MKTKAFLSAVVLLMMTSCYSTRITQGFLMPENRNKELLSRFKLEFDEESFSSVFGTTRKIVDEGLTNGVTETREVSFIDENHYSVEIKNLIQKYIGQNVPDNTGSYSGTIIFKITFFDNRSSAFLPTLSIITFGALNLIGLPADHTVHTVELQADFFDIQGRMVKTYTGFGRDSYLTGLYYHSLNQKRPSFIKAAKLAIAEIDRQISMGIPFP